MCLAVPGRILSAEDVPGGRSARVSFGGVVREARLDFVPEAQVGDYVLVHVGLAISRLDEAEAQRIFEALKEMENLSELEHDAVDPGREIAR